MKDLKMKDQLQRFVEAQEQDYFTALREIKNGRKKSHWMWYIFPQLKSLGFSSTSRFYGIGDIIEAEEYLKHPLLGQRLQEISAALLELETNDPQRVMGSPDDLKLKSSMTLFSELPSANPVFLKVLDKFFEGEKDSKTLEILQK